MVICFCYIIIKWVSVQDLQNHLPNKTNPIKAVHLPQPRQVSRQQQKLLSLLYNDLALRSPNKTITSKTFQTLFNSNAFWSRSLFNKFVGGNSDNLNLDQFIKGIIYCLSLEDKEQKIRFLFELYDTANHQSISYNQFLAILFSYPQEEIKIMLKDRSFVEALPSDKLLYLFAPDRKELEIEELDDCETDYTTPSLNKYASMESPDIMPETLKLSPKKSEQNTLAKLRYSKNFYKTSIIKQYANYIFHAFKLNKKTQGMSFSMFYQFFMKYPKLYHSFFQGFKVSLWKFNELQGNYEFQNEMAMKQGKCYEIFQGQKHQRFLMFVKSALIVFDINDMSLPIEIKTLEDLFVCSVESEQFGPGFSVKHEEHHYPQKNYHFSTKQQRNSWMKILHQFERPDILIKYRIQKDIGYGSYSHVHQCQLKDTGCKFAVKIIEKAPLSNEERDLIDSEWRILTLCSHPNILKGIEKYQNQSNIYLITQLLSEGSLYEYVKSKEQLTENEVWLIFKQLLQAVRYIHSIGLIHRDLKLNNILIKSIEEGAIIPIIIDFGLAVEKINLKNLQSGLKFAGTPGFVAPQLYMHKEYDETIDLFSLGVILYFLLSGNLPFHSIDPYEVRQLTCKCEVQMNSKIWEKRSPAVKDLVTQMIAWKNNRIDCEAAYAHQWVVNMQSYFQK